MGYGYALGSVCFVLGSTPLYFDHVAEAVTAATFFIGSVFFTTAASVQMLTSRTSLPLFSRHPDRIGWWSASVQWVGTLEFNVSTFAATIVGLTSAQEKRLVWSPDMIGSILFLAASVLGVWAVRMVASTRRDRGMAVLNLLGSLAFGAAAIAAFVLPTTGEVWNIGIVNAGTALGGICFFVAGIWQARPPGTPAASDPVPVSASGVAEV
jgi:hypothetical protein